MSRAPIDPPDRYLEDKVLPILPLKIRPLDPTKWIESYADDLSKQILALATQSKDSLSIVDGIIYKDDRLYIPPDKVQSWLHQAHSSNIAGHGGIHQTNARLAKYWWPTMVQDTKRYINECPICQARKTERAKPTGSMFSFNVCEPGSLLAIDYLGPVTETPRMNRYIIVGIDCFTRFIYLQAAKDTTASIFADFLTRYIGEFGVPETILTDNAKTFQSKQISDISKSFGFKHINSTPLHSEGNSIAERAIQSVQEKINLMLQENKDTEENWDLILPSVALTINTTCHRSTGFTPHDIYARWLANQTNDSRAIATTNQLSAQVNSKQYFDQRHVPKQFAVDDLVWVKTRARTSKLSNRFERTYKVESRANDIYKLVNIQTNKILERHINQLKAFNHTTDTVDNQPSI